MYAFVIRSTYDTVKTVYYHYFKFF